MVRPSTNCSPMMRMACPTAARITGSPTRPASRRMKPGRSRLAVSSASTSWPVSIRPQVEALTNTLSDWPRWLAQSALPIFSAIKESRVPASGVRRSASARHISASPSRVPRLNSCRKLSTTPCRCSDARAASTSATASACTAARSAGVSGWRARRLRTTSPSEAYLPSSSASQCAKSAAGAVEVSAPSCMRGDMRGRGWGCKPWADATRTTTLSRPPAKLPLCANRNRLWTVNAQAPCAKITPLTA